MKFKNFFEQRGITLIVLVVTIVVLLILAGVSINAILGDNGIVNKAKEAQNVTDNSTKQDKENVNKLSDKLGDILDARTPLKANMNGYVPGNWTNKDIIVTLTGKSGNTKYQYSNDNKTWADCNESLTINSDQDKMYYFRTVDESGNVKKKTEGYSIKRDTTKPTMGFYAQKSTTGITWKTRNISDTGSGIEVNNKVTISHKITLESDEKYVVDYEGTESTKEITGLTSGKKYTIKATVKDKAGNIREARKEIYFSSNNAEKIDDPYLVGKDCEWNYTFTEEIDGSYSNEIKEDMKNSSLEVILSKYCSNPEVVERCEYTMKIKTAYQMEAINYEGKDSNGMYTIELCYPDVTDDMEGIAILYFSKRNKDIVCEYIVPEKIDKENKMIEFKMKEANGIIIPICDSM